jgi:RNA polymerase sigma-54 factor
MQLNQNLNIKHSQSIVMTPQLRQAIKLLQFSNLELSSYIEEEIEKNPFLENKKSDIFSSTDSLKQTKLENKDDSVADNDKDIQRWEDKFHNKQRGSSYDDLSSIEERIAEPKKNLRSHLLEQILLDIPEGKERKIAILLLDLIEPSGWISIDIELFILNNKLEKEITLNVLKKLQKLEPTGVFSRNLGECLRLQLQEKGLLNESIEIVTNNLEYLAKGEIQKLCKIAKVNEEKLSEYINLIKNLNPKPATKFSEDDFRIDPPDVIIEKNKKGWKVELNKSTLPAIKIEEGLAEKVTKTKQTNDQDKKFVSEAFNSAKWLLRAIEQRNSTTLKVAVEILKKAKRVFQKWTRTS